MIEKVKDSFLWEIEKRFKNPFLWAFLISWLFWNWRVIYIILFIDEKYVSLLPNIENTNKFITKYEYITNLNIVNYYDSILFPLLISIVIVIFIEWWTTIMIIILNNVKNYILWYEKLTKEASQDLKNELRNERKKKLELLSLNNDEILWLQSKISDYEGKIDQKVTEKLTITENKNIKRIKELEDNFNKSELISFDRLEKNKKLDIENKNINKRLVEYNNIEKDFSIKNEKLITELSILKIRNNELEKRLSDLDKPLDEKYQIEYKEFQNNLFFWEFWELIEQIEQNPYNIVNIFSWKFIKFLKIKNIIIEILEEDTYWNRIKYQFTQKWDKFVEYFLDEDNSKNNNDEISIKDIPF